MALVQYGSIVTSLAGKLGGHVYQRNRKGDFVRTLVRPRTSNLSRNILMRNNMSVIAGAWQALTPAYRADWATEALGYTFYNRFGLAYTPSAYQLFVFASLYIADIGLNYVMTAPAHGTNASTPFTVSDWDLSAHTCTMVLDTPIAPPMHEVITVSPLSNSGNELVGLQQTFLCTYQDAVHTSINLDSYLSSHFGSSAIAGKSFRLVAETIRYPGFQRGSILQFIINIV